MKAARNITFWISLFAVCLILVDLGFNQNNDTDSLFEYIYLFVIVLEILFIIIQFIKGIHRYRRKVLIFDILLFVFLVTLFVFRFYLNHNTFTGSNHLVFLAIFLIFIRKLFAFSVISSGSFVNPAQLFVLSFFFLIMTGTVLLSLPNATHEKISFTDALFTSTSAVCVTGLIVVDTGSYFTVFGQIIIMVLIQLGGLGIMTFTSYFSYFFKGGSTYSNQILLKELTKTDNIADVFKTLKKILFITAFIEIMGAFLIYCFIEESIIPGTQDRIFFSVFHTISGFCNAGFSTLAQSFYSPGFRFNYPLHIVIASLFITGGIGFPILFNSYKYVKHLFRNRIIPRIRRKQVKYVPWVINLNTRIVVITTLLLIITGTTFFYVLEYNNTLAEHSAAGKIVTAFFGAVTPRTAGFNTVDTSALNISTIIIIIFLMWVGASPGSTGGGVKTSTLAISILNFFSIARDKNRLELFNREVTTSSTNRAFAIISLSILVIGISIFLLVLLEPGMEFLPVVFECFSAFSTVGLSQGITSDLGNAGKIVLIFTMFIGRISMLTILVAFIRKVRQLNYKYPTEEILIN